MLLRRKKHASTIGILLFTLTVVSACQNKSTPVPPTKNTTESPTASLSIPRTIYITQTETPMPTATMIPADRIDDPLTNSGLIILAMIDGSHRHLFAYNPFYLMPTRITSGNWNYDQPKVSPDGSMLAYCSDQTGYWEIYIDDLFENQSLQLTNNRGYSCSPEWSPDGQYLAYEIYRAGYFDIIIQSTSDPGSVPIQLTDRSGNNYSPAWSPGGREIAFVSDRNGRNEIWLANLDTAKFISILSDSKGNLDDPKWSPDGTVIAWSRTDTEATIQVMSMQEDQKQIRTLGVGSNPEWLPDGSGLLATIVLPDEKILTAYHPVNATLLLPPIPFRQDISTYNWASGSLYQNLKSRINNPPTSGEKALWEPKLTVKTNNHRYGLVALEDVSAPEPYLSDRINESFENMRKVLTSELGWDYLAILENAAISLTSVEKPGIVQNWLYTGRAIATDLGPMDTGNLIVTREDYYGKIYWRVWLKCAKQDGSCGTPMRGKSWNFNATMSGGNRAYEDGGAISPIPAGFWIDFTEFSARYGWSRMPAASNWRAYFPANRVNLFINDSGLSWEAALLELYPPEALLGILAE